MSRLRVHPALNAKPAQSSAPEISSSATGVELAHSERNAIRVIGHLLVASKIFEEYERAKNVYALKNAMERLVNAMFPVD